jgi:hypothetical protein
MLCYFPRAAVSTFLRKGVHTCSIGVMPVPPAIIPSSRTMPGVYVNAPLGPFIPTASPISNVAT